MAIYFYSSNDTSAPVLSGTAGTLINVLDACLVNGYGSKSPIGQTKEYSATNMATYRMPVGTSRMYMAVDDTGTMVVRQRGFQDVTAAGLNVLLGTNPFPNDGQFSGGLYFLKSVSANTTPIAWNMFSDGTIFHFQVDTSVSGNGSIPGKTVSFGDIVPLNPDDTKTCMIIGQSTNANNVFLVIIDPGTKLAEHYMSSRYDGMGGSVQVAKGPLLSYSVTYIMGNTGGNFLISPDPLVGGLFLSPICVLETYVGRQGIIRGMFPGIQSLCNSFVTTYNNGDILTSTRGDLTGRSFQQYRGATYYPSGQANGGCLYEISDTQRDVTFL